MVDLVLGAYHFEVLTQEHVAAGLSLGYILLIPGVLLSGLLITLDSWARAFRQGGFLNYGVAAYNTYAQVHNTYSAIKGFGDALGNVRNLFGGRSGDDRDDRPPWLLVVLLAAAALAAGILTTVFIIWRTAARTPLPPPPTRQQFEDHARNIEAARR